MLKPRPVLVQRLNRFINVVHNPMAGWCILITALFLTFSAYWISSKQFNARAHERFVFRASEVSHSIEERLVIYEQALYGGVGLFNALSRVSRNEWHRYVTSLKLTETLPGIQAMGFSHPILASEMDAHIKRIQAEGFTDYVVRPTYPRPEYSSIVYIEPFDWRNQRALGYDMWSNDMRREAMARARDMAVPATSALITLVQETDNDVQFGFLTYLPVYTVMPIPETVDERRKYFYGWVYAAFRMDDLMKGILDESDKNLTFQIYDGDHIEPKTLMYNSREDKVIPGEGYVQVFDRIVLQGRPWRLVYNMKVEDMVLADEAKQPFYILIAGIIIDLLIFYVLASLFFVNRHAHQASKILTTEHAIAKKSLALQTHLVEAKEAEAQIFFELAPDAFLIVSSDGTIVRANRQAHDVFGYDVGLLCGNKIEILIPDAFARGHDAKRSAYVKNPVSRMMERGEALAALKRNGDTFLATINLVSIELNGAKHVVAAVHDVSAQKMIEKNLSEARIKAESTSRAKSDFIANMSHEIRTPLNAVLGAAQLLEKNNPSVKQKKYINMIRNSGSVLLGVINDILDLSKIESGKMELDEEVFNLDNLLQRVAVMMSLNVGERPLDLVIHVSETVTRELKGDALRLLQVLINLTSNAIKFTMHGRVILRVDTLCTDEPEHCRLHFAVIDTGIGMSEEQQKSIFEAFTQADTSITRRFGGTGLGLIISNQIVNLMGGKISVKSEENHGSIFSFAINLAMSNTVTPSLSSDKKYKLLLIEASDAVVSSVKHILKLWGWDLYSFNSLRELHELNNIGIDFSKINFCVVSSEAISSSSQILIDAFTQCGMPKTSPIILSLLNTHQATSISEKIENYFDGRVIKPITPFGLLEALNEGVVKKGLPALLFEDSPILSTNSQLQGVRILLVEDNLLNQNIADDLLADSGVVLTFANHGQEAVDILTLKSNEFDIVLMDIQMPVMDGVTATKIIRDRLKNTIPIVAMTAGVLNSEKQQYLDAGMDDLVPKPIDGEKLIGVIEKHIVVSNVNTYKGDVGDVFTHDENLLMESNTSVINPKTDTLQVFNATRLESITKGKLPRISRVCESLSVMNTSSEKSIDDGFVALQRNDRAEALHIFHGLKGVCANYGAETVNEAIGNLERAIRDDLPLDTLAPFIEKTRKEVDAFLYQAQAWCQNKKSVGDRKP